MTTPTTPADDKASLQSITIISHSGLIYWWPVWLVGFILAALTAAEDSRLAVLPAGTTVKQVEANKVYELTLPADSDALKDAAAAGKDAFPTRISRSTDYGMVFIVVVLVVVFGANVHLRGMAAIAAILFVLLVTVVFAAQGWWTAIFHEVLGWHIQITLAGYLVTSVILLVMWLCVLFLYDPLRYMTFTPGQLVLHKEIGDMKQVFDTTQVSAQKRKMDLFRQWVLGFGAGDLIIMIPGQAMQIELPNVLFADRRVREIANLMKMKPVIRE
jgi:hypothetical protein